MIKFSVIVPIYNVEQYLSQCIESVLKQTYTNFELILVDDGSSDRCPQICDNYAQIDNRIMVIHKPNGGLPAARNAGIRAATGEYIIHLDGDDFWDTKFLSVVYPLIEKEKKDIYLGNSRYDYYGDECKKAVLYSLDDVNNHSYSDILHHFFYGMNCIPTAAWHNIYKTDFIKDNNFYFDETLTWSEDADNFYRVFFATKSIGFFDYTFYYYRKNNLNAMTKTPNSLNFLSNIGVSKRWFKWVKETNWKEKDKLVVMHRFANANIYMLKAMDVLCDYDYQIVLREITEDKEMLKNICGIIPKSIYFLAKIIGYRKTGKLLNLLRS